MFKQNCLKCLIIKFFYTPYLWFLNICSPFLKYGNIMIIYYKQQSMMIYDNIFIFNYTLELLPAKILEKIFKNYESLKKNISDK